MAAGRVPGRVIADDDPLTQHGTQRADGTFSFRNELRADKNPPERSMSLLDGALSPAAAASARRFTQPPQPRDAARWTTAGTLRSKGFRIEHTPRLPRSPLHVSVYWEHGEWDDGVAMAFDSCFGAPKGGRDG